MVRITRQKVQQQSRRRGGGGGLEQVIDMARTKLLNPTKDPTFIGVLVLLLLGLTCVIYMVFASSSSGSASSTDRLRATYNHPNLHLADKNSEQYNALALDILQTLDCHKLLNTTSSTTTVDDLPLDGGEGDNGAVAASRRRRRRLQEEDPDLDAAAGGDGDPKGDDAAGGNLDGGGADSPEDDDVGGYQGWDGGDKPAPTAKHLFCLAAFAHDDQTETGNWKNDIKCDATGSAQKLLLDLWSRARSEITDTKLLLKVLGISFETTQTIAKKELNLWAPSDDVGLEYMLNHVNDEQKTVDKGGIYGLEQNLGPGKVFVDVGSCLGTTSMAIALLYPGTRIVSVEVASPNWFLQEVNFRCNAPAFERLPLIFLAGVGPAHETAMFAKYMWKPDQVTTARAWTPKSEIDFSKDVELAVKLRSWHSILAEAEIFSDNNNNKKNKKNPIDVLNVDCGACEYNLIPAMTDSEFDSITTVMGGVHWGYIPRSKLPSSQRGKETHERLCKHENFARMSKECCQFPNMEVISSYPGSVLVQEDERGEDRAIGQAGTVADVAGSLCDDYPQWAAEKHIQDVASDWGWFQLTAYAQDE